MDAPPIGWTTTAGIVVAGDMVYFTMPERGVVARVPAVGGTVETIASDQLEPTGLALDAQFVYWSNVGDGSIWRTAR